MDEITHEPIETESELRSSNPQSFVWRAEAYRVADVVPVRQDWTLPEFAKRARGWQHRRHRNCFSVRMPDALESSR